MPEPLPGFVPKLSGSLPVLSVYYYADPRKRPGTSAGDAWLREAASGYPGGVSSPRWKKEMEIQYFALGGSRLFPEWEHWVSQGQIVIPPFEPRGYKLFGSYDHGWNNPAAFHVHGINSDGEMVTLWEFYADRVPVHAIARMISGETITVARAEARIEKDRRVFPGNPYAGQLTWIVADPSMFADDQPMKDEPNKSIAELFRRCTPSVILQAGERGGDQMVAEWLLGDYWRDPRHPRYRITRECPYLIWELGRLRFKDLAPHVAIRANDPERLVDKDDHAFDGLKMFLKRFPPRASAVKPEQQPATFDWWRRQAKRAKQGLPAQTFAVRREMIG